MMWAQLEMVASSYMVVLKPDIWQRTNKLMPLPVIIIKHIYILHF